MISIFSALIILVLGTSNSAFCATAPDINISVKFDHSFYQLELDKEVFAYREGPISYRTKIADCNKAKATKLADQYRKLYDSYPKSEERKNSKFDVELVGKDSKIMRVARGTEFGTYLRNLPKEMMYFNAEVKTACKR